MDSIVKPYGVVGAGSFGITIANLISQNGDVLIYTRNPETVRAINELHFHKIKLRNNLRATNSLEEIAVNCDVIFPILPSDSFREVLCELGAFLTPRHILIHGTKGFDVRFFNEGGSIRREHISTMSQVIEQETVVRRIGCLSGPNLSAEILQGQPAATVVASQYTEVIKLGQAALKSKYFQVYGNHDILGAELAGALKNIIALGAGLLHSKGLGRNVWALLITRGLAEMVHIGKSMGAGANTFLGVAGIGDLVATAASENSRNFQFGSRFASGESVAQILENSDEVAEGVRTLRVIKALVDHYKLHSPITEILYRIFYRNMKVDDALEYLMSYPYAVDVDFI